MPTLGQAIHHTHRAPARRLLIDQLLDNARNTPRAPSQLSIYRRASEEWLAFEQQSGRHWPSEVVSRRASHYYASILLDHPLSPLDIQWTERQREANRAVEACLSVVLNAPLFTSTPERIAININDALWVVGRERVSSPSHPNNPPRVTALWSMLRCTHCVPLSGNPYARPVTEGMPTVSGVVRQTGGELAVCPFCKGHGYNGGRELEPSRSATIWIEQQMVRDARQQAQHARLVREVLALAEEEEARNDQEA